MTGDTWSWNNCGRTQSWLEHVGGALLAVSVCGIVSVVPIYVIRVDFTHAMLVWSSITNTTTQSNTIHIYPWSLDIRSKLEHIRTLLVDSDMSKVFLVHTTGLVFRNISKSTHAFYNWNSNSVHPRNSKCWESTGHQPENQNGPNSDFQCQNMRKQSASNPICKWNNGGYWKQKECFACVLTCSYELLTVTGIWWQSIFLTSSIFLNISTPQSYSMLSVVNSNFSLVN